MNDKNSEKDLILVVDDQPNNLKVIASVLNDEYKLSFADRGAKALKILERIKPKLILLDVMMPEMTGYEVCEKIQADKSLKEIPVIFLTAKSDIEDIVKGFEIGAVDYITKPFNSKEVKVRIKTHISLRNAKLKIVEQNEALEENAVRINMVNKKLFESQQHLKELNKELEKSIIEKDKFFSIIAHDVKSPLNGLLGFLTVLNEDSESFSEDEKKQMLVSLFQSTKSVCSLLEHLLEWSRIQRKSIELKLKEVSAYQLIKDISDTYSAQLDFKNITFKNMVDETVFLMADENMLKTVFRNLISNAIKFTERGGKLEFTVKDNGDNYEFALKDSGIGMKQETIDKLFRIDENVSRPGTEKEKGTGLGLILCKEFIELHKGKIWVESIVGKGTTFLFTIPK